MIDPELAAHSAQTDRLEAIATFLACPLALPDPPDRQTLLEVDRTIIACLRAIQKIAGERPPNVTQWTDDYGGDSCGRVGDD